MFFCLFSFALYFPCLVREGIPGRMIISQSFSECGLLKGAASVSSFSPLSWDKICLEAAVVGCFPLSYGRAVGAGVECVSSSRWRARAGLSMVVPLSWVI